MKKNYLLVMLIAMCFTADVWAEGGWKLLYESEGVTVSSREVPGSNFDEFKVEGTIHASIEAIGGALLDIGRYPQWVPDCIETSVIERTGNYDMVLYYALATPFPLKQRDVVLKLFTTMNNAEGEVVSEFESFACDKRPVRNDRVRITLMRGKWVLKRIAPMETHAMFVSWADPGGNVPSVIVNSTRKKNPFKTFTGLRNLVLNHRYAKSAGAQ